MCMSIHVHHLAVQLPVPAVCDMYSMKRTIHWTGATNVFVLSFESVNHHCLLMHSVMVPYTFFIKPKMESYFVDFLRVLLSCSLFAHINPSRTLCGRHSKCSVSLAVIQQQTRESSQQLF